MKNTVENNILLAEFLGWETDEVEVIAPKSLEVIVPFETVKGFFTTSVFKHEDLKFHNDWNWLMLVVDKIESIIVDGDNSFNVTIGATNYCVIQDSNGVLYDDVEDGGESKLLTVYFACVRFVKWHNENKH